MAAWGKGVGSCWLGAVDKIKILEILNIDEKYLVDSVIALGKPAEIYQAFVAAMIEGADIDAIMPDGVHPWAEGHRMMAMEMVAEVAGALQPGCG